MSAVLRELFLRMLDAMENGDEPGTTKAAEAFRAAGAHEDVFVLNRGGIGSRGTLRAPAPRRWVNETDVERAIRLSAGGRGGREVLWAVGDVAGPEAIPLLERLVAGRPDVASAAVHAVAEVGGPEAGNALARITLATAPLDRTPDGVAWSRVSSTTYAALEQLQYLAHADAENPEAGRCASRELTKAAFDGVFVGHRLELPVSVLVSFVRVERPEFERFQLRAHCTLDELLGHAEDADDAPTLPGPASAPAPTPTSGAGPA